MTVDPRQGALPTSTLRGDAWRLRVEHATTFAYSSPVIASYNEARLSPLTDSHQTTLTAAVETTPATRPRRYWDWFGTLVHAFDLHEPHEQLSVLGRSVVEVEPRPGPGAEADVPTWEHLRSDAVADALAEHLTPTPATPPAALLLEPAREAVAGLDPAQAVEAVSALVRGHLAYRPGTTGVATTAPEAWEAASGVCQDFAHVALSCLRGLGLPARYVSGYLHPAAEVDVGTTAVGESHAWVEVWLGAWVAYDVTNGTPVHQRHVTVGRGREYADVAPLRGVFAGAGAEGMTVAVEIERLR